MHWPRSQERDACETQESKLSSLLHCQEKHYPNHRSLHSEHFLRVEVRSQSTPLTRGPNPQGHTEPRQRRCLGADPHRPVAETTLQQNGRWPENQRWQTARDQIIGTEPELPPPRWRPQKSIKLEPVNPVLCPCSSSIFNSSPAPPSFAEGQDIWDSNKHDPIPRHCSYVSDKGDSGRHIGEGHQPSEPTPWPQCRGDSHTKRLVRTTHTISKRFHDIMSCYEPIN